MDALRLSIIGQLHKWGHCIFYMKKKKVTRFQPQSTDGDFLRECSKHVLACEFIYDHVFWMLKVKNHC